MIAIHCDVPGCTHQATMRASFVDLKEGSGFRLWRIEGGWGYVRVSHDPSTPFIDLCPEHTQSLSDTLKRATA